MTGIRGAKNHVNTSSRLEWGHRRHVIDQSLPFIIRQVVPAPDHQQIFLARALEPDSQAHLLRLKGADVSPDGGNDLKPAPETLANQYLAEYTPVMPDQS